MDVALNELHKNKTVIKAKPTLMSNVFLCFKSQRDRSLFELVGLIK